MCLYLCRFHLILNKNIKVQMELMNVYTGSQQTYCPRYQVLCLYQHTVSSSYGIGTSFHRIVSRWISIQGVEPRY